MLLVDPNAVEVAEDSSDLDQLGTSQAADQHHTNQLAVAQAFDDRVGHVARSIAENRGSFRPNSNVAES